MRFWRLFLAGFAELAFCPLMNSSQAIAAVSSISIVDAGGQRLSIDRQFIKLTPVDKQTLYSEILRKELELESIRLQYERCSKSMSAFHCWQMYGEQVSTQKQKVPSTLLRIPYNPIYIVLTYRLMTRDINDQKRLGDESFLVCLNPAVPLGYWTVINQYKPILRSVPRDGVVSNTVESLKYRACKEFAKFPVMPR